MAATPHWIVVAPLPRSHGPRCARASGWRLADSPPRPQGHRFARHAGACRPLTPGPLRAVWTAQTGTARGAAGNASPLRWVRTVPGRSEVVLTDCGTVRTPTMIAPRSVWIVVLARGPPRPDPRLARGPHWFPRGLAWAPRTDGPGAPQWGPRVRGECGGPGPRRVNPPAPGAVAGLPQSAGCRGAPSRRRAALWNQPPRGIFSGRRGPGRCDPRPVTRG